MTTVLANKSLVQFPGTAQSTTANFQLQSIRNLFEIALALVSNIESMFVCILLAKKEMQKITKT